MKILIDSKVRISEKAREYKIREVKPLHVRVKDYEKVRKILRREIANLCLHKDDDTRLYTRISINEVDIEIDSGETVTVHSEGYFDVAKRAAEVVYGYRVK